MGLRTLLGWGRKAGAVRAREADEDDDAGWRRGSALGGTWTNPDRDELDGERLLREAFKAYRENPLGYAIVEQQTSFVRGGGAKVVAEDARVQRVIDDFWDDEENKMGLRIYSMQTELSMFGEQFIRFFADPVTGRVVIRPLDPLYVTAIETDEEDIERVLAYRWRPPRPGGLSSGEAYEGEWVPAA